MMRRASYRRDFLDSLQSGARVLFKRETWMDAEEGEYEGAIPDLKGWHRVRELKTGFRQRFMVPTRRLFPVKTRDARSASSGSGGGKGE